MVEPVNWTMRVSKSYFPKLQSTPSHDLNRERKKYVVRYIGDGVGRLVLSQAELWYFKQYDLSNICSLLYVLAHKQKQKVLDLEENHLQ